MIRLALEHETLSLGVVAADEVVCGPPSEGLESSLSAAQTRLRADASAFSESMRVAVRDVLRKGGYKPTGRGKPASEFLLAAALGDGVPRINNLVDINNLASLEHALPISVFDRDLLGDDVWLRFGSPGERYVFNASGQTMDISGLPVVCRTGSMEPVGNAVKDSMRTKVSASTQRVLVVIYGPRASSDVVRACAERVRELLVEHAGAQRTEIAIVP